ncbi:permeases of drug/metabolite transporter superfamily [Saccharopolyspora erythraea NRRL 2338]|uniref:Permeases of drug/metabolite transporter superfamily n=1 Tax=Saccharopolyspora erythraea (strain ATCC 11635 / DSM 40517 / JCM 4748 / NBRC 13426 / NCIMB 8594 / NRRL 2338) TaxID=405948 RepID=A4FLP2_SACEN|nr:DMT family permease [Saccharopolyspora erythraea D]QRK93876.1 DMT family transporter [Saccharopolyspora erythraea]CAM04967.1 permeases of drug/metabolite transporter superfamily [Saccharopolyspora erythraea NRRL 2338]
MRTLLPLFSLVAVTAVWGGTFVVVKDAVSQAPTMDFLAMRFLIATAALAALRPSRVTTLSRAGVKRGILLGMALGVAYIAQTFGLEHTSASLSGFITGMLVVFTPVIAGLVLRQRIGKVTWTAVAIAVAGLGLMTVHEFAVGPGELLTLVCAVFLALHIVGLGVWSPGHDAHALTVVQLAVAACICFAFGWWDGIDLPSDGGFWLALVGTAVIATAAAYVIQTWAQARLSLPQAAVVLTLEPVFACIFGVVFDHDELTTRIVIGGALVVGAMYLAELRSGSR